MLGGQEHLYTGELQVDLVRQLSNPDNGLENAAPPGVEAIRGDGQSGREDANQGPLEAGSSPGTDPGQHSNPPTFGVNRRLRRTDVDDLVLGYQAGQSLRELAARFGVHHRTVADHLQRNDINRRPNLRKMRPKEVIDATIRYRTGVSLATLAAQFEVDPATVRRELHRAGEPIRPRRGTP